MVFPFLSVPEAPSLFERDFMDNNPGKTILQI